MTYEEAVKHAKDIPLHETQKLRSFIFSLKDSTVQDQICAKWFSIASREIKYLKEPTPPEQYKLMADACAERNPVSNSYAKEPAVKMYIETKIFINSTNCGNYERIKLAIDLLHPSEFAARKELIGRLVEFINGTTKETDRPFPGYEFFRREDIDKYGIQQKAVVRGLPESIQRDNTKGGRQGSS